MVVWDDVAEMWRVEYDRPDGGSDVRWFASRKIAERWLRDREKKGEGK